MASPPDCPFCSSKNVTVTHQYEDQNSLGVAMVRLSCGDTVVTQGGAWVRLTSATGGTSSTSAENSAMEGGRSTISAAQIAAFQRVFKGKNK